MVQVFHCNPLQENAYLLWDDAREGVVVDPGFDGEGELSRFRNFLKERMERGKVDCFVFYENLSENVFTFVDGKILNFGETRELRDNAVIRLSNDRMLLT